MFIRRFTDKKLSTYIRTSQPICTRLTAQIVKVAVNQPVAIRSSMWVKNNQNIHFMNLHVKKLEKLLLF
ncbi:hypothetical protein NY74_004125 [Salmonella enterica subsp. enterica]|nr:hypothetical protein [Salmonella enterica subsp. enterica]